MSSPSLPPGTRFGSYEILAPIGAGGMDSPRLCQEETFLPASLLSLLVRRDAS
jgi:hypothetical protein